MSEASVPPDDFRLSRPGTKARRLQDLLLAQMERHLDAGTVPTSNRFLLYELEQQGDWSKTKTGARRADQDLIDQLTYLRERGLVAWDDIVDESRHLAEWSCAPTVGEDMRDQLTYARVDPWVTVRPFVITEACTVGGVLQRRIAPDYLVPVAPINGQCHGFLMTRVVPMLRCWLDEERTPQALYIGDYDLAGNDIEDHARRVLERELGLALAWERLAITEEQTLTLRRQGIEPIEKIDRRFTADPAKGRHLAFEAEALGQGELEGLLRDRLDALLPEPLDRVLEREQRQRRALDRILRNGGRPKTGPTT